MGIASPASSGTLYAATLVLLGLTALAFMAGCGDSRDSDQIKREQSIAMHELRVMHNSLGIPILDAYKAGSRAGTLQELMAVPGVDANRVSPMADFEGRYIDAGSLEFEVIEDSPEVSRIRFIAKVNMPADPDISLLQMTASYFHSSRPITVEYEWK